MKIYGRKRFLLVTCYLVHDFFFLSPAVTLQVPNEVLCMFGFSNISLFSFYVLSIYDSNYIHSIKTSKHLGLAR
jgi:hypothetical protein